MTHHWYESTARENLILDQELLQIAVSEAICEAMDARGVNRAHLARLSGITRSALSQRLSGRRSMNLDTVASTLHHLGYRLKVELVDQTEAANQIASYVNMDSWDELQPEPDVDGEPLLAW